MLPNAFARTKARQPVVQSFHDRFETRYRAHTLFKSLDDLRADANPVGKCALRPSTFAPCIPQIVDQNMSLPKITF